MSKKFTQLAVCYDFDGTLSPGYMQNYAFIPDIGMTTAKFWAEVKEITKKQNGDEILIYMGQMLIKAKQAQKSVKRKAIQDYGNNIELFNGVMTWFDRINKYGKSREVSVKHFIISSGLREMIEGTPIAKYFEQIFASGFWYDHEGVAIFPALGVNYTTKTQFLFRINKGSYEVWDKEKVNRYVTPDERPVPFKNIVFLGDGDTDIPCFRLVKDLGGHSIAVYKPRAKKGGKSVSQKLLADGRVNFAVSADYSPNSAAEKTMKAIIDKVSAESKLKAVSKLG